MVIFKLNGKTVKIEQDGSLLRYLRDEAGLLSVKDGCSQGACGTCMVLIDGEKQKACTVKLRNLAGKSVLTLEGFTPEERDLYARAFAAAGAVQCGFCIPGMVISAKALLDQNPDPSRAEVKEAIKGNICRCTGYAKIETAIMLAAAVKRGEKFLPDQPALGRLGQPAPRPDAYIKAAGTAKYADDYALPGMIYGVALRPPYARATVNRIDIAAAKALPGVVAVLTAADIPGEYKIGHLRHDYPVMIPEGRNVHFLGDAIALVAAESEAIARAALELIQVDYTPLPPVLTVADASREEDRPLVHQEGNLLSQERLVRGDVDEALAKADFVVTNTYELPLGEHAFLEPECALGWMDGDVVNVLCGDQGIYQTKKELVLMLGLPPEKVRVRAAEAIGGGFGGKEDMSVQHHAALLAYRTGRPVKVKLTRDESLQIHPKRHPMTIVATTACDKDGNLLALRCRIQADTGAYASLGGPVLQRACTHACGPYHYRNLDVEGQAWYTNNPPAGPFRGFGVTQSMTATESNIDQLAELTGTDPWEFRYKNGIRPGERLPNGQIAGPDTALIETLEAVKPYYDAHPGAGIACCLKNSGLGVGIPDVGRCRIVVQGGQAHIHCSASGVGQGMGMTLQQMTCDLTGLPLDKVVHQPPDTFLAPDSGNTTASRQTLFAGEATLRASRLLLADLEQAGSLDALEGKEYYGEYLGETDRMDSDKESPRYHVAYSYATHCVILDEEGKIDKVVAAHDVGTCVNPLNVEGQIEGGVVMSLGYALTEKFTVKDGRPQQKYGQIGLMKAPQVPEVVSLIVNKTLDKATGEALPAAGAKGIGEIASIPTPAAVLNAYYKFSGQREFALPMQNTPYSKGK